MTNASGGEAGLRAVATFEAAKGVVALLAASGAGVRFTEAYGLWNRRTWAEWFGVASGAIYVPFDLLELVRQPGLLSVAMLSLNLLTVGYLARQLRPFRKRPRPGAVSAK